MNSSILFVLAICAAAHAQTTTRVSVSSSGTQGDNSSHFSIPSVSADGRYVAFSSYATNLVAGDTNGVYDVFVHDRQMAATTRVSVSSAGLEAPAGGTDASISDDGRFVAFDSGSDVLVPGDLNNQQDVFVHDRLTAQTSMASLSSAGTQANNGSIYASISGDGRYVAFQTLATNLVPGDTNAVHDIFVRDMQLSLTTRVSVSTLGVQGNHHSESPAISADGRFVAFPSVASNLVAGDTNATWDFFVHDRQTGATSRVSVSSAAVQANDASLYEGSISADGRFVAFQSFASNLVAGDTNGNMDIFVHDRLLGLTTRESLPAGGGQANNLCATPSLSADGRYVAFESYANNLVASDTNSSPDIFVRDRQTGQTTRESLSTAGVEALGTSNSPTLSDDGRFVLFASAAANLVPLDTNGFVDSFVRDLGHAPAVVVYCTAGVSTNGCAASISGSGTPSASAGSGFTIAVTSLEGQRQGLIFYGVNGRAANVWSPGSSSFLCVKSPTQRTAVQNSGGNSGACDGAFTLDFNAYRATHPAALGQPMAAGLVIDAQSWFRDPPAPNTTNLSNALEFTLGS